ncbi:MAG: proline--tRNA ligase [Aggregatilineales bacterium]
MSTQAVTPRSEDFSKWYNEIVLRADLADYAPVRGCMIIKPYGYALWENVQAYLDRRFKESGHQNAYFPLFIPESFMKKEADHVEGFAPELAVVTHGGGEELAEKLIVRPTSETIIGHSFAQWIHSHRDLPMLINQWANVVRWEMRTKLFLRTLEFLWQEGHTAHATYDDAQAETLQILRIYEDFSRDQAAIPGIPGFKSEQEKFPGALRTYSVEAMMGDKRALQFCTSHNLGQNFAKVFDIQYTDANNTLQYCWTTSWGLSTRVIGGIIMAHGDDQGLRLPPRLAPIQVVIVPIHRNDDEKAAVLNYVDGVAQELRAAGIRVQIDKREGLAPGFKFNDWEMRGVPVRLEIGPRDVQNNAAMLARRDKPGKEGKRSIPRDGIAAAAAKTLEEIQASMLAAATAFRDANIHAVEDDYAKFREILTDSWAYTWFCGDAACEAKIKEDNQAVSRCFPIDQEPGHGKCIACGNPATHRAYFAKAY